MAYFTNIHKKLYYWHLVIAFIAVKYLALTAIHFSQYLYISGGIPADLAGRLDPAIWTSARPTLIRVLGVLMYLNFATSATNLVLVGLNVLTRSWKWFGQKFLTGPDKVIDRSIFFYVLFKFVMGVIDSLGIAIMLGGIRPTSFNDMIWAIARPALHSTVLYFLVKRKYNKWLFFGGFILAYIFYAMFIQFIWHPVYFIPDVTQPFPAGPMLDRMIEVARRISFPTNRIFLNTRLTLYRNNAFATGIGKLGVMVIGDQLWQKCGDDDTMGVVMHELGHWYYNHPLISSLLTVLQIIADNVVFFALITRPRFYQAFDIPMEAGPNGYIQLPYGIGLILTDVLLSEAGDLSKPIFNIISWVKEYQADEFACRRGYAEFLYRGLAKISGNIDALCNLPFGLFYSTHPIFSRRFANIARFIKKE